MALPTNVKTLLSGNVVEWARIEFKESWKPEASLKTICAFANDLDNWGGGYLVIGVEDDNGRPKFPIKGLDVNEIDDIMKDLLNKCKQITPDYLPIAAPVDYDEDTKLIVVWCPGGQTRPYRSPSAFTYQGGKAIASKDNTYFIRKMASTVKPSEAELNELFSLANQVPFDDRICHQAELADLNLTLIKAYLYEIGSALYKEADTMKFEDLCMSMGICNTMPEFMKPKNVGLMFFGMEPDKYMPYAQIDVVEFPEGVGGDQIVEKIFKGPLHQQLRDALQYIKNSVIKEQVIKYPDRAEADRFYNYPYAAIEEALANAVYHKAYDIREPIEVRIERNKIEILSFPGPDRSVTQEKLKTYQVVNRRYRNRRIGEFLKELHLTEGRNTGFRKILNALERNGSPKPEFETDDDHSYFITRLYVHEFFENDTQEAKNDTVNDTVNDKTVNMSYEGRLADFGKAKRKNAERILRCININSEISIAEIKQNTGLSERTIARYLKELKEKGVVVRVGADKNGHWKIL